MAKWLIDANQMLENIELLARHEDTFRQSVILGVAQTIRNAPTVDAVEVVRCKDCKHWDVDPDTYGDAFGSVGTCFGICDGANTTKQDDFCSFGERRC